LRGYFLPLPLLLPAPPPLPVVTPACDCPPDDSVVDDGDEESLLELVSALDVGVWSVFCGDEVAFAAAPEVVFECAFGFLPVDAVVLCTFLRRTCRLGFFFAIVVVIVVFFASAVGDPCARALVPPALPVAAPPRFDVAEAMLLTAAPCVPFVAVVWPSFLPRPAVPSCALARCAAFAAFLAWASWAAWLGPFVVGRPCARVGVVFVSAAGTGFEGLGPWSMCFAPS
jgi:hypothetical protein